MIERFEQNTNTIQMWIFITNIEEYYTSNLCVYNGVRWGRMEIVEKESEKKRRKRNWERVNKKSCNMWIPLYWRQCSVLVFSSAQGRANMCIVLCSFCYSFLPVFSSFSSRFGFFLFDNRRRLFYYVWLFCSSFIQVCFLLRFHMYRVVFLSVIAAAAVHVYI